MDFTATLRVPLPTARLARVAHGALTVDAEPRPDEVTRACSVEGR